MTAVRAISRRLLDPPVMAFLLVGLTQSAYVAARGPALSSDSQTYATWARTLVTSGFDYSALLRSIDTTYPAPMYLAWVTIVALFQRVFGTHWAGAIVALNVLAEGALAAMIASLATTATKSMRTGYVATAITLLAYDLFSWNRFVLSDSTFAALAFIPVFLLANALLKGNSRINVTGGAAAIIVLALLYRPTAVALLPGLALFAVALWTRGGWPTERLLGALAVVVLAGISVFAWMMASPARWPLPIGAGLIQFTARHYGMGEVVWDRPNTFHTPPSSYLDFLFLTVDRIAHFFAFYNEGFSLAHKIAACLFFVPLYVLSLRSVVGAFSPRNCNELTRRRTVQLLSAIVVFVAVFHGMIQVDFDWRYRVPVMPYLVLLAAIGLGLGIRERAESELPEGAVSSDELVVRSSST